MNCKDVLLKSSMTSNSYSKIFLAKKYISETTPHEEPNYAKTTEAALNHYKNLRAGPRTSSLDRSRCIRRPATNQGAPVTQANLTATAPQIAVGIVDGTEQPFQRKAELGHISARSRASKKSCRSLSRKSLSMGTAGILGSGTARSGTARSGGVNSDTGKPGLATNRSSPVKATLPASATSKITKARDPAGRSQPPSSPGRQAPSSRSIRPKPRPRKEALERNGGQAGSTEASVEPHARNSLNRTALGLQTCE